MRIFKLAQQNFQMIPQNPTGQPNPDVQLQNLQNSQQALQSLKLITSAVSELMAKVADVDDAMGLDTGLRSVIEKQIQQSLMQTPAYQMLAKMGIMADPSILQDANKISQIEIQLQRNITDYTSGLQQPQSQQLQQ